MLHPQIFNDVKSLFNNTCGLKLVMKLKVTKLLLYPKTCGEVNSWSNSYYVLAVQ